MQFKIMNSGFSRTMGSVAVAAALFAGTLSAQLYTSSTIAGSPEYLGYGGDGGPAVSAQLSGPIAVAVDSKGNFYIADYGNNVIRKVFANGVINTFAGTAKFGYSGDGGPATAAQLSTVHGLAVDASDNLYIADTANGVIRKVDQNGIITTFAGTGKRGFAGNEGPAIQAEFIAPAGLAFDPSGNLYVADPEASTVRRISPDGKIHAFAGNALNGYGPVLGEGGYAFNAILSVPYAVASDAAGNIYVGDVGASAIVKIGADARIHTILTGVGIGSLAADRSGNVFFANYANNTIGRIGPDGTYTNIAGDTNPSFSGDGGPALYAEYNQPYGVAADAAGNVYVTEYLNDDVRLLSPIPAGGLFVANGASNLEAAGNAGMVVAPGMMVTLFGYGLGDAATAKPSGGQLPLTLGNATVTLNGVALPIVATAPSRVSVLVPSKIAGGLQTFVVSYQGTVAGTGSAAVFSAMPGIFTANSTGNATLAIQNSDGSVNSTSNAAAEGSNISIFLTGAGAYASGLADGQVATTAQNVKAAVPTLAVLINGENAAVSAVQTVPGQPGGVLQVIATLPADVKTSGSVPVQVSVGGVLSQLVTIAVQ